MKFLVTLALALAVVVALSNAACYRGKLTKDFRTGNTGCLMNEKLHSIGDQWKTEDCLECSCSSGGSQCCTTYFTPAGFNTEECESIFDKASCSYNVVKKDDHSVTCEFTEMIG
ncbi:beta-microseminoprotein [Bombina bombina]|uniref:beta-microseminoprotein n=1 Tax=Bombina bombina TaxID=8345 RepID=UPI00235A9037|nr:beta-microseminoprotein [Bombina bombina]